jgi:TRAP-type mannitol/chloroaromatic compound transport system permease small subunit
MIFIGAVSAVVRYFSRDLELTLNLTPATEIQWYLFSAIFLLGAAYALRRDAHVRVDVVYERLGAEARGWVDLVGTLIFLVPLSVLMLWVSFPAVQSSWRIRETSPDPGGLPRYPIKALILVSFALLLLQAVSQLLKHIDAIRGGEGGTEPVEREPETRE